MAIHIHRTNINLNMSLVKTAASILATSGTTETVHAALQAVIREERLKALANRDFADLTPQTLEQLRQPRTS